jgi:hypothetical protein
MNNNRRKKEMALFIAAISLALSVILLGGTGAFAQTLTTLHDFGANRDGQNPQAGVVFDQQGNLYGTTIGAVCGTTGWRSAGVCADHFPFGKIVWHD